MSTPARFPNGITNNTKNNVFGDLPFIDPTKFITFFDDFHRYAPADWTITTVEAGSGSATEALTDLDGGGLVITTDNAANDTDYFQTVGEMIKPEANKKLFFKTRYKINTVANTYHYAGLLSRTTDPQGSFQDGIFFKTDTDTQQDLRMGEATLLPNQKNNVLTWTNNTFNELAFYYNGNGETKFYVNGNYVWTFSTTDIPEVELCPSFGLKTSAAATRAMTIDYIFAAKER